MGFQIVVTLVFVAMTVAVMARPQLGAGLVWIAIWLYPHTGMYGFIPGDVRLDDLFVCAVFVICLKKCRGKIPMSGTLGLAMAWYLAQLIGNLSAVIIADQNIGPVIKVVLKATYVPMTVAIISMTVRDRKDIEFCVKWICVAGVAAAILGIATVYYPRMFQAFLIHDVQPHFGSVLDRLEGKSIWARRATGSLGIMATALVLLNTSLLSLCHWLFDRTRSALRSSTAAFVFFICAVGLVQTQTRGAMLACAVGLAWGLFHSKRLWNLFYLKISSIFALMMFGYAVLIYKPGIIRALTGRFTGESGMTLGGGVDVRMGVWQYLIHKFDPVYLFTGIGMVSSQQIYGRENWGTAHNAYLGSFVYTGVFGFLVLVAIAAKAFKLSGALLRVRNDALAGMMGTYLRMLIIGMLITAMSIENFQQTVCMQVFFAGMLAAEMALIRVRPELRPPVSTTDIHSSLLKEKLESSVAVHRTNL